MTKGLKVPWTKRQALMGVSTVLWWAIAIFSRLRRRAITWYYSLASDGAIELLHPSLLFVFPSSYSSLLTLLPEKRRTVFGFPKRQSWFLHEKLKLSLWKSKDGSSFFWKKNEMKEIQKVTMDEAALSLHHLLESNKEFIHSILSTMRLQSMKELIKSPRLKWSNVNWSPEEDLVIMEHEIWDAILEIPKMRSNLLFLLCLLI